MIQSGALSIASDGGLAELVDPILQEALYWFPVRHHSPAAAHFVASAITKRKPRCVLLEAPAHLQHLLPFLLEKTRPPIALYSSARPLENTDPDSLRGGTSWYPLLEYSPEWQAIMAAQKVGAEIRFIDLPHFCQPVSDTRLIDASPDWLEGEGDSVSFFQYLADRAGYLNWHECWDTLFEHTLHAGAGFNYDTFRQQLLYFAAAARHQSTIDASSTMLARECYMWGNIKRALEAYEAADVMVVCGALHVFMQRSDKGYDQLHTQVVSAKEQFALNTTVVPYSYRRVAMQQGYAAGNRAPFYYYRMWRNKKNPDMRLLEHVREIISMARNYGQALSAADNLAVAHHARLLAQLRNRAHPVLDDIEDAVWACCCKGDPAEHGVHINKALAKANIGTRIGSVNPDLGQLPLVADFYAQLHLLELNLPSRDENRRLQCDLRTPEDIARSQFLHRLRFLRLPCASLVENTRVSQARLFSERWQLSALGNEELLVEHSEYGDTIDTVVQAALNRQLAQQQLEIDEFCAVLVDSQVMGLGVFHGDIPDRLQEKLQRSADFIKLTEVFKHLLRIWHQQKYLDAIEPATEPMLALCFLRAALSLGRTVDVPSADQPAFIEGLRVLAEAWISMKDLDIDRELFEQEIVRAASGDRSPLVHGCCFGLLLETGRRSVDDFCALVEAFANNATAGSLLDAAIWIEGVMYTTKVSMLSGADHMCSAIDLLLRKARQEDFLTMLPRLRAGFEALPTVQRESLAVAVARRYGLASSEDVTQLPTDYNQDLSGLDQDVQTIMEQWGLAT